MDIPISCTRIEMQRRFSYLLGGCLKASPPQKYHKSVRQQGAQLHKKGHKTCFNSVTGGNWSSCPLKSVTAHDTALCPTIAHCSPSSPTLVNIHMTSLFFKRYVFQVW